MRIAIALRPNKTVNHHRHCTYLRDPEEIEEAKKHMISYCYLLIMIPNTVVTFAGAYRRNEYSLAVLNLVVLLIFALFDCFLPRYLSMPKNEKSSRRLWLKLTMWFMFVAIAFGFVFLFSYFLSFGITVALYAGVVVFSVFLLNAYIIVDIVNDWKTAGLDEDEIGIDGTQAYVARKVDYSDCVLEKV
ncbi:hypothetical protein OSB04_007673 [Centaurea solstitialis]|uniref:Uncharacterized protein n=1 Tax=Centaurea solstitialis TaxID=347529 RepID=A0AA38TKB7_9ASTR|nr:hypothetical protein OSB04_007673 [Centaurea solstitialis]